MCKPAEQPVQTVLNVPIQTQNVPTQVQNTQNNPQTPSIGAPQTEQLAGMVGGKLIPAGL